MSHRELISKLSSGLRDIQSGVSLIEIASDKRVLIENHCGIAGFGSERIVVRMQYGFACICGKCLQLYRISQDQVVISGEIHSVQLANQKES